MTPEQQLLIEQQVFRMVAEAVGVSQPTVEIARAAHSFALALAASAGMWLMTCGFNAGFVSAQHTTPNGTKE